MHVELSKQILAAVVTDAARVKDVPTFVVGDESERDQVASLLGHILDAIAHDLKNGVIVLVRHA